MDGHTVDAALGDPRDHPVSLANQFIHPDGKWVERGQLLTQTFECGSRLVDLTMDDLVVVHDIMRHELGQVSQPTVTHRLEEAHNHSLAVVHHGGRPPLIV
ncbi:hypothetical protein GCM10017687_69930 [Streptomyces echinatus]